MTELTVNLSSTQNTDELEAEILVTIKVAAQPHDKNEPIPCKPMVVRDKFKTEGGLTKTKMILDWHFNFQTLTVTLPKHKYIVSSSKNQKMIRMNVECSLKQHRHDH